ncbi:hypothetical protein ZPAH1_orf00376 [Aeromonas phage ZPAH1]|nr:hypothetical protein ZPAH1_orf00376 [Aeromonas phage ZPAH1]
MKTKLILGSELTVGMRIIPWSDRAVTITKIEKYEGPHTDVFNYVAKTENVHEQDNWSGKEISISANGQYPILVEHEESRICDILREKYIGKIFVSSKFHGDVPDDEDGAEFGGEILNVILDTDGDRDPVFKFATTRGVITVYENDTLKTSC